MALLEYLSQGWLDHLVHGSTYKERFALLSGKLDKCIIDVTLLTTVGVGDEVLDSRAMMRERLDELSAMLWLPCEGSRLHAPLARKHQELLKEQRALLGLPRRQRKLAQQEVELLEEEIALLHRAWQLESAHVWESGRQSDRYTEHVEARHGFDQPNATVLGESAVTSLHPAVMGKNCMCLESMCLDGVRREPSECPSEPLNELWNARRSWVASKLGGFAILRHVFSETIKRAAHAVLTYWVSKMILQKLEREEGPDHDTSLLSSDYCLSSSSSSSSLSDLEELEHEYS